MADAQTTYHQARSEHQQAARTLANAEQSLAQVTDQLDAARDAYLDALGAPPMGTVLPFDDQRVVQVSERHLEETQHGHLATWRVGGYLQEARGGTWVPLHRFVSLNPMTLTSSDPSDWQAHAQALLDASLKRGARMAKQPLRLGRVEQSFLTFVKFETGLTSFTAPHRYLFAGSTLMGNVKLVERLHRKGVLTVPDYEPGSGGGIIPDWYFRPLTPGPRATEAKAVLAAARVVTAMKRASKEG